MSRRVVRLTLEELADEWHPTRNDRTPWDVTPGSDYPAWWSCSEHGHEWQAAVKSRTRGSGCPYCAGKKVLAGFNDVATRRPDLAAEWHPSLNEVQPDEVTTGSGMRAWWSCSEGHEWQQRVATRSRGIGCPFCAGQRVVQGSTDITTTSPELAAQWHPTRNERQPSEVSAGSSFKAWWICSAGHQWQAAVSDRSSGRGCPVCSGNRVMAGINDLLTLNPEVAPEWHPTRNDRNPSDVSPGSEYRAWWSCSEHGHEWQAAVNSRSRGSGCPYCAGTRVLPGFNDLATLSPELAAEWHPIRNDVGPDGVARSAARRAWWACSAHGHEWEATVNDRANGRGCPYCGGDRVLAGFNDLASRHPAVAAEWHPIRNVSGPDTVTPGTARMVWWTCAAGHEWEARVYSRVAGRGCPICAGKKVLAGFNDLATTDPKLSAEWHPTRNALLPADLTAGMTTKVWWRCASGHEWEARANHRTRGAGCPTCANRKVHPGFNDLASARPDLAAEWHLTRNTVAPDEVTVHTSRKVWWLCSAEGHEWEATVGSRSAGNGCPSCASYGFDPDRPAVVYLLSHRRHEAYKVGIANVGGVRLQLLAADGWDEVATLTFARGEDAAAVERAVLSWVRDDLGLPAYMTAESMRTGGHTETFAAAGLDAATVLEQIRSEAARRSG